MRPPRPLPALLAFVLLAAAALALPVGGPAPLPNAVPEALTGGFAPLPLIALPAPTALAFGPGEGDGPDLYATTLETGVLRVSLTWTPAGPVASGVAQFATGFSQPLGLIFDGVALYVSDSHPGAESGRTDGRITRIDSAGAKVVVDGLPNGRHNTNHFRFGPDDRLYVSNGNPNDNGIDGGEVDVLPLSGAILSFVPSEVGASPAILHWKDAQGNPIPANDIASAPVNADFAAKVHVFASGFRNVYGIAFHGGFGYTGMNGADVPSSQDALFKLSAGQNFSYPFCFNEGVPAAVGAGISVVPNPTFAEAALCAHTPAATALLGWHTCATGLDFPTDGPWHFPAAMKDSVFVGECGPFNPDQEYVKFASTHNTGHKVVRVPLDAHGEATAVQDFLDGMPLATDVLFGPDGAMYVAHAGGVVRVVSLTAPLG